MNPFKFFLVLLLCASFINCGDDDSNASEEEQMQIDPPDNPSSDSQLIDFSVTQLDNPSLSIDADVQRSGNNFTVFFPFETDLSNLVASFSTSTGASLIIDGQTAVSGTTAVDFSNTITAQVQAEDGSTTNFIFQSESNFESLDSTMQQIMAAHNLPSVQLAITQGERLVYQAQYGFADEAGTIPVTNDNVYRIASNSKVITDIAIMKMMDDGLLELNDTVFGVNGILETDFGTAPYMTNYENIQVSHLMDHLSGFTNNPNDPFFVNPSQSLNDLIDEFIDTRPLGSVPGTTFLYTNMNYCILGRIIEKISGIAYEDYVKQEILGPLGITEMNLGASSIDDQLPNEVEYVGQEGFNPYDINMERLDALGGWTASATDLAKFMVGIDRQSNVPDIISGDAFVNRFYDFNRWGFFGSLPGTSSVLSRVDNEFNLSIVTNSRTIPTPETNNDLWIGLINAISERNEWPNYDLFTTE